MRVERLEFGVMKKVVLILLLACFVNPIFSQDVSTQGTEFWVSFMGNGFKNHPTYGTWLRIQLLISAKDACNCTITNPQTGWADSFRIEANSTYLVENIDWQQAYMELYEYETVSNKGLRITTTDTVSVYCANIATYSFDASYVMPIEGLADDYLIQTYDQSGGDENYTSAFLIVATEDNTTVDITPSVTTMGNRPADQEFSVTLNKGQSYQVRSSYSYWGNGYDLSGSRVTARDCKKIAVFNGNNLTLIPTSAYSDADCVFEQAMPIHSWGKRFIVTASMDRTQDYVKITSAANGNAVLKNGSPLCTLDAGESYVFTISSTEKSCYLEASHSCAVFLYNTSSNSAGNGAPSMVWIAPIEQRIDEITFSTFNYDHENVNINNHYVNVIVSANDIHSVYLDNTLLSPLLFEAVNGNPDYRFYRTRIDHGVHHLACANGFNAHVYGFGQSRGYAYMVGSKATDLSTTILVNNEAILPHDTISNCSLDPITFGAEINFHDYEIEWDFGDGTTSNEMPVVHTYSDHELFEVTLTVTSGETPCESSSSTSLTFYIDCRSEQDVHYYDDACIGQLYSGYGFEDILIHNDTILVREESSTTNPDCTRFVYLNIAAYHVADTTIHASTCFNGASIYTQHGFHIPYNEPGTYYDSLTITSLHGCDSTIHLILEVGDTYQADPDVVRLCYDNSHPASYTWIDGVTYTTRTYIIKTLPYGDCEGIFTLDLDFYNNEPQDVYRTGCNYYDWEIDGQTYHYESSGNYSHFQYIPDFDCQLETRLHLTLTHRPQPNIVSIDDIEFPNYPITATEFNVNRYNYSVSDEVSDTATWDFNQCVWGISKPSWRIVPSSDNHCCTVYAMDWVEDTIWLTFKAVNPCTDGEIARYWLKPSFYDLEDNSFLANFTIAPNPNSGKMELRFEHLTGNVDLKVYDMRGLLIDRFDLQLSSESCRFPYDMKGQAAGIYFIVATTREGTLARKIVVRK